MGRTLSGLYLTQSLSGSCHCPVPRHVSCEQEPAERSLRGAWIKQRIEVCSKIINWNAIESDAYVWIKCLKTNVSISLPNCRGQNRRYDLRNETVTWIAKVSLCVGNNLVFWMLQKVELVCLLVRCDWFVTMLKHTVLSTWFMMARNSASESRRPCSVTYSSLEASGDASLSASLLEVSFFGVGWSRNEMRWKGDQVSWLWSDRKTAVAGTRGGSGLCWCLNLQVIHSAVRSFIIHTPFYQNSKSDLQ